ncbi:cytochrome c oxidase assembly factor Coa1 family protein [Hanstruepera flava]|uniref:cytochrome c oxidase assembly factor Coa1 family protein n=1 Tax=Hanstruepera flava TaxID=2930218 RepID=UPI002028C8C0|nr:cytochrome c oxidase assembly factor Coa1 family protein [Hanstruepera flava]
METVQQKSWFARNWPWVIPVGGCLTVILLFVFGVGAAVFGVSKALKNSTPYAHAIELANDHPDVIAALGHDIEPDGMFKGNISLKNGEGHADLKIPVEGEKGKATIVVKGDKYDGDWSYEELYVIIKDTQEEINLLDKSLEGI